MLNSEDIYSQNPWWTEEITPEEAAWPKRDIVETISDGMRRRQIQLILGLRRTGKSTILKQLIGSLLEEAHIEPENILFFSFDKYFIAKTPDILESIIQFYLDNIKKRKLPEIKGKVYFLLDEIQYVEYWQDILKRFYDRNKNMKFIISGSQSAGMRGSAKESLAGRIVEYYLPPLSFYEYLAIGEKEKIPPGSFFHSENMDHSYKELIAYDYKYGSIIKKLMPPYLCWGQFPEISNEEDPSFAYEYISESVLGKIVENDLPAFYRIENREAFKMMTYHLMTNSSSLFEIQNITGGLGISKVTAENYFSYIQQAYLIDILYKKTRSRLKQGRTLKKAYAESVNFICAVNNYTPDYYDKLPEIFGKIVETYVYSCLKKISKEIFFWRESDKEIDFLIRFSKTTIPIEVKFSATLRRKDCSVILKFSKDNKLDKAVVLTKNKLDKETVDNIDLFFIPFYLI